jgi:F0F1-type ATP synthase membrane subunit b/b'
MVERTGEQIQQEIEQARASLGATIDALATRTSPKRLTDQAKQNAITQAQTPAGKAVIGGVALLVVLLVARKIGKRGKD